MLSNPEYLNFTMPLARNLDGRGACRILALMMDDVDYGVPNEDTRKSLPCHSVIPNIPNIEIVLPPP